MRLNSKGQVTIPARLRERHGLHEGDEVDVIEDGDTLRIVRSPASPDSRGAAHPQDARTGDDHHDHGSVALSAPCRVRRERARPWSLVSERPVTLVDSSVLLDVVTADPAWSQWSEQALAVASDAGRLVINQIVYAEVSVSLRQD